MTSRRSFLGKTIAAGIISATSLKVTWSAEERRKLLSAGCCKKGLRIKSLVRRDDTITRYPVNGDNWHMTWAADDHQYVSLCDGYGYGDPARGKFNSRMLTIEGSATSAKFGDLVNYPFLIPGSTAPRYYNFGTLALGSHIYQFLSTFNRPAPAARADDLKSWNDFHFSGAKLIFSPDNGTTWCNQNGSTPVTWEDWSHRSRKSLAFFDEPQSSFSLLTVLQMGRNYEANRDGYVYIYAPNGTTEGTMNELVMVRAPKAQILNRESYEFFSGRQSNGGAKWSREIDARASVHTFPSGWVNKTTHPYAWQPSVAYNAPLGLYMMSTWGMGCTPDGDWFGKPSYLGIYTARNPWGPWTQIHEEEAWTPNNDPNARAYQPQIAPKWIAPDGKSFWLVWTDFQTRCPDDQKGCEPAKSFERVEAAARKMVNPEEATRFVAEAFHRIVPYYEFNTQRIDLSVV